MIHNESFMKGEQHIKWRFLTHLIKIYIKTYDNKNNRT